MKFLYEDEITLREGNSLTGMQSQYEDEIPSRRCNSAVNSSVKSQYEDENCEDEIPLRDCNSIARMQLHYKDAISL
jgi:hypothetical protein